MYRHALDLDTQEAIHRLWDELADFDLSQSDAALNQWMTRLAELGGVWNVTWGGAIRMGDHPAGDPLQGWRVAAMQSLRSIPPSKEPDGHFREILDIWDRREIDPSFLLPLREVGTFRTYSLRRGLPTEWFESPFYRSHYGDVGIHDAVFVAIPLNQDCESHFGFYSHAPITDESIARLAYAVRGIKWFIAICC